MAASRDRNAGSDSTVVGADVGRLDRKVAIVTGAAQGMGAATARLFAAEGATVVLADVSADKGGELARSIGGDAEFQSLDVRDEDNWNAVVAETVQRHGRVDLLVNNAGIMNVSAIEDLDIPAARRLLDINVTGPMIGAKTVAPLMKSAGKGVIVNISSLDGLRGANGLSAYCASKWAVRGLTKSLAFELGPYGVRVCSVHPGGINTTLANPTGLTGEELQSPYKVIPLQRIGEAEEVARATLFVASDEASYMTGSEIVVDGGAAAGTYYAGLPGAALSLEA